MQHIYYQVLNSCKLLDAERTSINYYFITDFYTIKNVEYMYN